MIDRRDDKNVSIELSTLIVIRIDDRSLLTGYKSVGDGIIYHET